MPLPATPTAVLAPFVAFGPTELDALRLDRMRYVPEVQLYLAEDAVVLQARLEARFGPRPVPFWATAWVGGQVLARYLLDNPRTVAGRRVLDLASGSGLVGIAAALAGAAEVTANDVDPFAMAAIEMNAAANGVDIVLRDGDLLDGDGGDAEVVLAGDVLYTPMLATRMSVFLRRCAARGARVLVGDPDRGHVPPDWMDVVKRYSAQGLGAWEDSGITDVAILRPAGQPT